MALIAVGSEHRLGVDIEQIRVDRRHESLAERFFSLRERAGLRRCRITYRRAGLLPAGRVRKLFLKATGDGLSFPLSDFSVSTHPDLNPELEESEEIPKSATVVSGGPQRRRWLPGDGGCWESAFARLETYS